MGKHSGEYRKRILLWKDVHIFVEHDTYREIKEAAKKENQTIADYIRTCIEWKLENDYSGRDVT